MRSVLYLISGFLILSLASWGVGSSLSPTASQLYAMAQEYEYGNDTVEADSVKSTALYLQAANMGYTPAQNYLGYRYYLGRGVSRDVDSALYWIRSAARQGDVKAAGNLGYLLSQAPDVRHDYSEALFWLTKAEEAGLPSSYALLAEMKKRGLGCVPDTLGAIALYDKAINLGQPDAQLQLLAMMGYKWNELPPDSAVNLGLKYYLGKAPVVGIDLFEKAAQKGNAKAMALLGDAYSRGIGVAYDHDRSTRYFFNAALRGNPSAQFIIAELLDIFPDALDEEIESESAEIKDTLRQKAKDYRVCQFWYEKASAGGVSSAEEAYTLLFTNE